MIRFSVQKMANASGSFSPRSKRSRNPPSTLRDLMVSSPPARQSCAESAGMMSPSGGRGNLEEKDLGKRCERARRQRHCSDAHGTRSQRSAFGSTEIEGPERTRVAAQDDSVGSREGIA